MASTAGHAATPPAMPNNSGQETSIPGYNKLAVEMSNVVEKIHLRSFKALLIKLAMYRQAKVLNLELDLEECERADLQSADGDRSQFCRNWTCLEHSDSDQLRKVRVLEDELGRYFDLVFRLQKVVNLPDQNRYELEQVQTFLLKAQHDGDKFLNGLDSTIWGTTSNPEDVPLDLISLRTRDYLDPFSKWIGENIAPTVLGWFNMAPHEKYGANVIMDETLMLVTDYITTILASQLPFAFVLVLYFVNSMLTRLIILGMSNLAVALVLPLFTVPRRIEIFAVIFALLAVQVVFVNNASEM